MKWKFLGSTSTESFIINGIDIFKEKWVDSGEYANVVDPIYGSINKFSIWYIKIGNKEIKFAAGEFSNGVFGIYTRRKLFGIKY